MAATSASSGNQVQYALELAALAGRHHKMDAWGDTEQQQRPHAAVATERHQLHRPSKRSPGKAGREDNHDQDGQATKMTHRNNASATLVPTGLARQPGGGVPNGELHVWIYQARQLAFRRMFASMYERHGLHLRTYLVHQKETVGVIQESRRNYGGNMSNPMWRKTSDDARDRRRGHFALALQTSIPKQAELVIEIVCGILVVASTKIPLHVFVPGMTKGTSDQVQRDEQNDGRGRRSSSSSSTRLPPHWFPLLGEDTGVIEIALEVDTTSASATEPHAKEEDDDDDSAVNPEEDPSGLTLIAKQAGNQQGREQDDQAARRHAEDTYAREEQRQRTRRMRFETPEMLTRTIPEPTEAERANQLIAAAQHDLYRPQGDGGKSGAFGKGTTLQERLLDKQLWDLYYFGISNARDMTAPSFSSASTPLPRSSSTMSQISHFSSAFSDYSERSEASFYGRKASTCASDILAYNDLIQEMESSIETNRMTEDSLVSDAIASGTATVRPTSHKAENRSPPRTSSPPPQIGSKQDASSPSFSNARPTWPNAATLEPSRGPGVVLFDPAAAPPVSELANLPTYSAADEQKRKEYLARGRRRSLPLNQLTRGHSTIHTNLPIAVKTTAGLHTSGDVPQIDENDSVDGSQSSQNSPHSLRRQRSASLHSLTDLWRQEMRLEELEATLKRLEETTAAVKKPSGTQFPSAPLRTRDSNMGSLVDENATVVSSSTFQSSLHGGPTRRRNSNGNNVLPLGNGGVLSVGKFIKVGNVPGVIRYIGPTHFASGMWIGIELCERKGKNNGIVKGYEYFTCAPDHGIFIRANRLDVSTE